jgi:hypothetical protein
MNISIVVEIYKILTKEGKLVMEQKIEVLLQYEEADFNERLHLFLGFPDMRRVFQEIERKDLVAQMASKSLGEEHRKGRYSRILSLLG